MFYTWLKEVFLALALCWAVLPASAQLPPVPFPSQTLLLQSETIDRLATGNKATLEPDGFNDGVFVLQFALGSGEHTLTQIELKGTNNTTWDTNPATNGWTLGVGTSLLSKLRNDPDGSVRVTVPDGGSLFLFASQKSVLVRSDLNYTLTLTLDDGSLLTLSLKDSLNIYAVLDDRTADRLGTGNKGLTTGPDKIPDGIFSVHFPPKSGERVVTEIKIDGSNGSHWDTDPTSAAWALGVGGSLEGPLLNASDGTVALPVSNAGNFFIFAGDRANASYVTVKAAYSISLMLADGLLPVISVYPKGDLNEDGRINIQDATLSLVIAVGSLTPTEHQQVLGDLNNDGKLNIQDASLILLKAIS